MCIYIHIYIYTCICIHIYIYVYVCVNKTTMHRSTSCHTRIAASFTRRTTARHANSPGFVARRWFKVSYIYIYICICTHTYVHIYMYMYICI